MSPDDVCRELGIEPMEYNRQARRLHAMKQAGEYRDR
jgi:hypothetical protein